jgi:hypothetical protein
MRREMRRAGIILIVLAAGMVATSVASAHQQVYFNTLSIRFVTAGGPVFKGNIHSQKPACMAKRRVTVFFKTPGGPEKIGADTTGADGKWEVDLVGPKVPVGKYYAQMPARVLRRGGGHYHACAYVKTPDVTIQP